jgi:hypothetical protein
MGLGNKPAGLAMGVRAAGGRRAAPAVGQQAAAGGAGAPGARFEEEIPNDQERGQCGRHPWLVFPQDQKLFRWFLKEQDRRQITGDLAELGVYMGKGAVVGEYLRPGETFTLIDLFESLASDSDN